MAYGLKYYKDLAHPDGKVVRLEILEKDYSGASKSIGPVCQSLRLDIQGDTEIDAPIVKTSLSMTFVDAPDHEEAATKKCGNWDEFYTSDATKWQVVLKYKKPKQTSFTTMWGGYITPDSFNEVLIYRGSINIVARDNIGHMNDFLFDSKGEYDGMISLLVLVNEAWEKIDSPMVLDTQAMFQSEWINSSGTPAYNTYMNISAFEGKTWFEALESALYAYGLVMRYVGDNRIVFYPLRNLPRMGAENLEDISFIEPLFVDGAERELTPAVRIIEESVDYDIQQSVVMPQIQKGEFTGATDEYTCEIEGVEIDGSKFGTLEHQAPVWPIANERGENWANAVPDATLFFNHHAYEIGYFSKAYEEEIRRYMYIAANNKGGGTVKFSQYINCFDMVLSIKFGTPIGLNRSNAIERAIPVNLYKITYAITLTLDGITEYYRGNGSWTAEYKELVAEYDATQSSDTFSVAIGMDDRVGRGLLTFHIIKIEYKQTSLLNLIQFGLYACIQSLTFDIPSDVSMIEKNNVNTNFDKQNNVILSRDPKIAPALNNVILPGFIKNGIFTRTAGIYNPAKTWNWGGQTPQQLAVYNHLQLLCYHAKPNNVLRGTIVNADVTDMQVIWLWHGAEHMFVSGSFNLLSGHIENAVLREFARYEDMWGILDEAHLPQVDGSSVTNVESGSASKNEGARNTTNTEVYLGGGNIVLDDYMSDSSENGVMNRVIKAYVDNLWHLDENGNLVTDKQVLIKNNLIIDGDTSSSGEGEDTPSGGISGVKVNGVTYYDDNGDGVIDLGTISGGGGAADLSNYYTKAESDARYLALNGGGQVVGSTDTPLYLKSGASDSYIGFKNSSDSFLGYYGFRGTTPIVYSGVSSAYYLIHSGNIESYAITPVGGTMNGALTSYGGFISYGTPSFTAIRESGWSYLRLQSASHVWDIATTNASDGMLNTPYALEFRDGGQGHWGFALRYNTSSYGIGVFVANGDEASIGFLSNSYASSNKLPQWVIGNRNAETFGFWNTSSARFGITISKDFSTNVEGNICINRPTNYSNNYDEGLRCNLGGSQSWAGVVIGGAAFSTSGAGVGVYSLLVNNQLFRIRQNYTDVLTINTSNQVNINGNLIVSGDVASA